MGGGGLAASVMAGAFLHFGGLSSFKLATSRSGKAARTVFAGLSFTWVHGGAQGRSTVLWLALERGAEPGTKMPDPETTDDGGGIGALIPSPVHIRFVVGKAAINGTTLDFDAAAPILTDGVGSP